MHLAIKTSGKVTEIYLLHKEGDLLEEKKWEAGRRLSHDLLNEIVKVVNDDFSKLSGLIVFIGPGSFTGLRIGVTVMNTLAFSLDIPIVGVSGNEWLGYGQNRLQNSENDKLIMPEYGGEANITSPKK